jgi:carbon-monoxide dehydrogenase medium subunit
MALWTEYFSPRTIAEALALLNNYGKEGRIVAGGTDLILDVQQEDGHAASARPSVLVDVTAIPEMRAIRREGEWVVIGAAATHAQIEQDELVRAHGLALAESCSVVGGPQVRNVATIGGNVAHALPAADGTVGLLALDAQAQVCSWENARVVSQWLPLPDLFAGPGRNTLRRDQLIAAFRFAVSRPRQASAFERIMRPQGVALPVLGVAARLTLDEGLQRVAEAAIAVGPAGPVPFRARAAEAVLAGGEPWDDALIEAAVAAAQVEAQLRSSRHRAGKEYRHEMLAVLLRRVLAQAVARARVT